MENFIQKYQTEFPQIPIYNLYFQLVQYKVKQNVIQYFFKNNIFLHSDLSNIIQALVQIKAYAVPSVFFLNSTKSSPHYITVFFLITTCIKHNIPTHIIKETVFSFLTKTKAITVDLTSIKDYFDIVHYCKEKPCTFVNLLVDLFLKNKLNMEVCQYIVTMKEQNIDDNTIKKNLKN